ncbi:MAG: outer membrane protein/protective antigen [Microbacterium sp.]|nr:outer membrane protein/protective antigen [Microbacterium sp.]
MSIAPADASDLDATPGYAVSEDVLRAVLVAVIPVAEQNRVDVSVVSGYGELSPGGSTISADLSGAVEALFASRPRGDGYATRFGEDEDGEVEAFTRTKTGVLQEMGLG